MKFLVIRFSSIGDIVLTTPVIRCLKQQVPNAEVHYLTKKQFGTILAANPYVDKLHVLGEEGLAPLIALLRQEKFDAVIDLHNNLRSARIKWALGVRSHSFSKLNLEKWLMVKFKINRLPDVHIVDRYMQTVRGFGVENDGSGLDYFVPPEDEVNVSDLVNGNYTGLVIGAAHATKKLPLNRLKELAGKLEGNIILLGGKEDRGQGEEIRNVDPSRIYNACGQYNLNQSSSLVRQARLIITHDTGLMHIAAAFQRPIVSVWGNTIPGFGMSPYLKDTSHSWMAQVQDLPCRPCSKIGYAKCPLGHFKCMEQQDIPGIASIANSGAQ
jgi:ADP-heptose:LPS heptosyltransferase